MNIVDKNMKIVKPRLLDFISKTTMQSPPQPTHRS